MKTAVYAGSFDPPTLGHLWMIEQGAKSFDELVVAIGINPDKHYAFSVLERIIMLKEMTRHLPNVRVEEFSNLYLIDYAQSIGATIVLRGIRNEADYESERTMRNVNGDINSSVTTFFLMPPREIAEISSSFVKGMIGPQCWERRIRGFLPTAVYEKTLLNWLWERWDRLFQAIGAKGSSRGFFERVTNPYTDAARKYHNLAHLVHF